MMLFWTYPADKELQKAMDLEIGRVLYTCRRPFMWWFPAVQDREAKIEDEGHEAHEASWLLQKAPSFC